MTYKRKEQLSDDVTLYCGDCRDVMSEIASESIDMIWTDPPYGHSNHAGDFNARLNQYREIESKPIAFDDADGMRSVVDGMLIQAARVLRHDCCCCCCCCGGGGGPRPTFAWVANRMDSDGLSFFHSVIWNKINPGLGWRYRRQHEMVMVSHRVGGKLLWANDKQASPNIFSLSPPRDRNHPNEKPLGLMRHFIELHSSYGQTVCDPFMGSGSTGVVCVELGRKFIGIELDDGYFDIACKRIEDQLKRPDLFVEAAPPKPRQEALDV